MKKKNSQLMIGWLICEVPSFKLPLIDNSTANILKMPIIKLGLVTQITL